MEKQLKHVLDFKQNVTVLDIPFSIHQSRCFSMDSKRDFWFPNCKVMPETSHDGVVCRCFNTTQVTANLKDATCKKMAVHQTMKQFKTTRGGLDYFNIWIVTLMGGLLVFYLVVFNYAQGKDVEDAMKPHLIYLADNDPSFKYKYLVGVYTGMRFNAGTSSNVTIVLEGTNCRSLSHVLQSLDQPVMTRGSHDWFLIRTKYNLGNILRVHLWTDYSGSSPEWYCQKIFIQDTKTRHVWVFNVERWFSPLVNDGTMACTSYQAKDQDIFRFAYRFNHCMNLEIQMGTHIALSIFNQNPFSGFSRAQRATVFMAYVCMLFYGTILITDYVPPSESFIDQIGHDFQYRLKMIDVIKGIFIALLVWPLRFILALCCRFLLYDDNPKTCVKWTKIEKNSNVQELQTTDVNEDKTKDLQPFICKLETCVTKTSPETLNLVPFMTENIYKETMYIAPGLIFLWWTLMIVIILSCIYKTIIHGFGLEDVQIKQFFVLSKITLIIGIGVLETFILFVWVLLKTLCSSSFIWIEDRTIEVRRMVIANKLPKNFIGPAQLALAKLRRGYVYRPLDARKCGHYKKISLMLKDYKGLINVTVLMAMMLGSIVLLLNEMYDPGRNLMGYKTERLLETRLGHRTMSYKHVRNIETFYQYINETILMNLYENFYGEQTGIAVDGENYLVGVPRVRQVRVAPVECQTECNFTDLIGFDTENYDPNWRLRTDEDVQENDTHLSHMWHYKEKDDLMISGRHSEYPISGYLTMLRRSSKQSQKILDYMIEYNWLGNRTRAAFIDFVLYNPKMNFLTLVQIVAEKVNFIEFSTSLNLQLINFYPENSQEEYFKLKILLFFLGLTIFLAYHELLGARNKTYWILNVLLNVSIVYVLIAYVSYYWALGKFESFIEKLNLNIFYNFYPLIDLNHAVIMNCVCVWVLIAIRLIHMICKIFFTNESMKLLEAKIVHYRKNLLYFLLVWSIFIVVYTIYNVVHVSITRISDQILLTFHTAVQRMLAMPSKYYRNQYVAYISVAVLSFFTLLIVLVIRWMLEYYIYCEYLENKKQEKAEISAEKLDAIGHLVSDMFMQNIGVEETKIDNKKIDRHGEREKAMASLLLSAFKPEENDPDESDTNEKDEVPEELIYRYKRSLDVINDFSMKMQNLETILQNTLPLFTNEMQKDEKNNTESIDQ